MCKASLVNNIQHCWWRLCFAFYFHNRTILRKEAISILYIKLIVNSFMTIVVLFMSQSSQTLYTIKLSNIKIEWAPSRIRKTLFDINNAFCASNRLAYLIVARVDILFVTLIVVYEVFWWDLSPRSSLAPFKFPRKNPNESV